MNSIPSSSSLPFPALPQLFQERFIQLCPIKVLHKFSCTNLYFKNLSLKRPMINSIYINNINNVNLIRSERSYCSDVNIRRYIPFKNIKEKHEVIDLVEIKNNVRQLQRINIRGHPPLNLDLKRIFIKQHQILRLNECLFFTELNVETYMIDFNALLVLIKQPLKKFVFKGGINFNGSYLDYKNGFNEIANIQWVRFTIMLYICSYKDATAEQILFFLMDTVRNFTEHYYEEKQIIYNNLTRKEAIIQCCNQKPST